MQSFDVIVIGMGPGGEHVAGELASAGLSVLGVEEHLVGGECPYYGCIPSKMMIRAGNALAEAGRVAELAGSVFGITPDWDPVASRIRDEATDDWDDRVAVERFEGRGGTFARGSGRIRTPGVVVVTQGPDQEPSTTEYRADRAVVVATGTTASIPPVPGLADVPYWTNREAIRAKAVPVSLVVLGGGAIGCELAQAFARFGAKVTVVEGAQTLLPGGEPEAGRTLADVFAREGIDVRTGTHATGVSGHPKGIRLALGSGDVVRAERLLIATGRRCDLGDLGLDVIGVHPDSGCVPVDDRLRVTEGVYAVGDVTGKGAFTHVAMYQAAIVVRDILGQDGPRADYSAEPRVTFTDPEIGSVGMTEARARESFQDVSVGVAATGSSARGWIHKVGNEGMIKIVASGDRIVGATAMGPVGGEVIGALTVAMHGDVGVDRLRSMIFAYPTFHRGIEDALRDLS